MAITQWQAFLTSLIGPALMGTEAFGNAPVPAQPGWAAGVLAAANDSHRVYTRWVNGNEMFAFRGDVAAANQALLSFAKINDAGKELVFLAGPGGTRSFEDKAVPYVWQLHVPSGIYLHMARAQQGVKILATNPTLTIHITDKTPIEKLTIPKGLRVAGADDLVARYLAGCQSEQATVRWQAVSALGPFAGIDAALSPVIAALDDDDHIVRIVAARMLSRSFGTRAKAALPRLGELRDDAAEKWRQEYGELCTKIENATDNPRSAVRAGQMAAIRAALAAYRRDAEAADRARRAKRKGPRRTAATGCW